MLFSTVVKWAQCHKLALGYGVVICLPQTYLDQMHLSWLQLVVIAWAGSGRGAGGSTPAHAAFAGGESRQCM